MKKFDTAKTVNNIGIFLLLAGSIAYHVQEGFNFQKSKSPASYGLEISRTLVQHNFIPSDTSPFFFLSK